MTDSDGTSRVRRRDQLRAFIRSRTLVIKKEINRYYEAPVASSSQSFQSRSMISSSSNSSISSSGSLPRSNQLQRTETQEIDDILQNTTAGTEIVQPQCMLFPTYACQVKQPDGQVKYKVVLAGWAFTKPGSGRLDGWVLGKCLFFYLHFLFSFNSMCP